jgi:signal transduction histidine kinase
LGNTVQKKDATGPELLGSVLDTISEGFVRCREGAITWASARAAEIFREDSAQKLIGRELNSLFVPVDPTPPLEASDRHIRFTDGEERILRIIPVCDNGDDGDEELYLVENITLQRFLEHEVQRANRELHHANRERVTLRNRVQCETEERDELLTVISHELRTPITVITGYNRLLLAEKVGMLNEEQKRFCDQSIKSCQRLNNFISNLLEASRESYGDMVLEVTEISVVPTLEGVASFLRPLIEEHGLNITFNFDPASAVARFDPVRIEQVITNLLSNAIKYSHDGGMIELRTRNVEDEGRSFVEICVADDGPGIAEEDRERIFDPYVRLGDSGHVGGLGLGLALCKRIVSAHSGTIGVDERPGGGSNFFFRLPDVSSAKKEAEPSELEPVS